MLLHQGFDVKMIAHVLPLKNRIVNGKRDHMSSQIAAGMLMPARNVDGNTNDERMFKITWDAFNRIFEQKL